MERENARRVESEEQLAERRLKLDYEDLQAGARLAACTASWDNTLAASAAGEQVNSRASNDPSRRFHNHGEGPY